MTGITFEQKPYGFFVTDGSELLFRGDVEPTTLQAIRAGGSINITTELEKIDVRLLEHVRTVRCIGRRYSSNSIYTIYIYHQPFGSPDVVIAENHLAGRHGFYLVDQLDAVDLYQTLATSLDEANLWTHLSSITAAVDCAKVRGEYHVTQAFREGRLVFEGRGSKRRAVLKPKVAA